jgi:excisionase family DNA binding protein
MTRFSAPNVDGHVDEVEKNQISQLGLHRLFYERLLTVRQVAEQLSVSRATIYKLVSSGALAHLRISNAIRIGETAFRVYVAQHAIVRGRIRSEIHVPNKPEYR